MNELKANSAAFCEGESKEQSKLIRIIQLVGKSST